MLVMRKIRKIAGNFIVLVIEIKVSVGETEAWWSFCSADEERRKDK